MPTEFVPEAKFKKFIPVEGEAFSRFMRLAEQQVASEMFTSKKKH